MVQFSKHLQESRIQGWEEGLKILSPWGSPSLVSYWHYVNYKSLKKKLKQYAHSINNGTSDQQSVIKDFSKTLDYEIEKVVLFLIEQQGKLAGTVAILGPDILKEHEPAKLDLHKIYDLQEAYRIAGQDLLCLVSFFEKNATAVRKVLKKFDKNFRCGFTEHYVCSRVNHPFSMLQMLFIHVGIAAIVGAISNGLKDLQEAPTPSNLPPPTQDLILYEIDEAMNKLNESSKFLRSLAQHEFMVAEELPAPGERKAHENENYHFMSLLLNLVNAFLYMVNTYVIVPTAGSYSLSLGHETTICGVVIGAMALAQVFSTLYLHAWSDKSYFRPLLFSSLALIAGNILYALAYDINSIWIILIGRFVCGLGYARPVNWRYISDSVPLMKRRYASVGLTFATALGVSCGPALAGLLQVSFKIQKFTFNQETLPGWAMAAAWLIYLVWLCISFKEPSCRKSVEQDSASGQVIENASERAITQSLLLNFESNDDASHREHGRHERSSPQRCARVTYSAANLCSLLTPSIKVQLLVYFMHKYVVEILLSGSSLNASLYFGWSTSVLSIFLAGLTLTVIPANIFVGRYISHRFEERQILLACEFMVCFGILLGFHYKFLYSVPQYFASALVIFIFARILQGVNLLLLSRFTSSRFMQGAFNAEVLSSEIGATARVVADVSITLFGHLGHDKLLNISLLPPFLLCLSSIVATCWSYNSIH